MNAHPRKLPIPLVLVLLGGFAVGVLAERAGWIPGPRTPGDPSSRLTKFFWILSRASQSAA